jgi:hypothetical protein
MARGEVAHRGWGSVEALPRDFGEAGGSPAPGMDGMQKGRMEGVAQLNAEVKGGRGENLGLDGG